MCRLKDYTNLMIGLSIITMLQGCRKIWLEKMHRPLNVTTENIQNVPDNVTVQYFIDTFGDQNVVQRPFVHADILGTAFPKFMRYTHASNYMFLQRDDVNMHFVIRGDNEYGIVLWPSKYRGLLLREAFVFDTEGAGDYMKLSLDILYSDGFNVNKVVDGTTILDRFLLVKDSRMQKVIEWLKKIGAKTANELKPLPKLEPKFDGLDRVPNSSDN